MTTSRIVQLVISVLSGQPGAKALEIAKLINTSRTTVNRVLYKLLADGTVEKDQDYQWFLAGQGPSSTETIQDAARLRTRNVEVTRAEMRGMSLFSLNSEHERLEVTLNLKHPFIAAYHADHPDLVHLIDSVFESAATAFEKHYTEAELFEEVVDDWGRILAQKISTDV